MPKLARVGRVFYLFFFFYRIFLSKNDPFQRGILVSSSIWWGYELVGERRLRKPKRFGTELLKIWQKKKQTKTASTTQALAKAPSPPPGASVRAKGGKKSKVLFALKKKIAFFCVGHFFFKTRTFLSFSFSSLEPRRLKGERERERERESENCFSLFFFVLRFASQLRKSTKERRSVPSNQPKKTRPDVTKIE